MKPISQKKSKEMRRDRNSELLRRMQNGEKLSSFNSLDSWYPQRPVIEKDTQAVTKLYGGSVDERLKRAGRVRKDGKGKANSRDPKGHKPLRLA